ncbi:hypothetical protein HN51_054526 [Arachis hypogaea]|uniref:Pentatricopeptide repeat-containing protein n=2 Tax=Arachis hypogaea TaxID=3818 RepID=A0A444XIS9_ARAHY|nr:Pentatricopeptide repeat-containing protein [Arachis hypogaea]RYQ89574.1 hypothetical protein Ahy_B09g096145 isoform B [Arachis hypogaea]
MLFRTRLPTNANTIVSIITPQHSFPIPITTPSFHHLNSPSNLLEARKLHALLLVLGFFHPNIAPHNNSFASQIINAYVSFSHIKHAYLVFSELPHKINVAWNAMLRAMLCVGHYTQAIELYNSMLNQGVKPDNYTYPIVLKACSSLRAIEYGRWVRETIIYNEVKHNIRPNAYVLCSMINMFAKCGSLGDARKVFDEMLEKDLASWTAMICGAVWNGELVEAVLLFRRMRSDSLKPDSVIVASLLPVCSKLEDAELGMALQGCAVRSGFDSDLYVSNALIDMYCKCGDPFEARFLFDNMVCRDRVSWSTLIAGYSQNFLYRESYELLRRMVNIGLKANEIVVSSVLPALGKLRLLKQGKEIHNYVLKEGLVLDPIVVSTLIDMYSNCGSMKEAETTFEYMSDKDIMLWNTMIAGYNLDGNFDLALSTFREIWGTQHRPNSITLVSVLPVCTKLGALRQGQEIHGYATKSNLILKTNVGNSLIDMYGKCGFLDLGVKVFNQMMVKNVVTYNTIISTCGAHGLGGKGLAFYDQMKIAGIRPNKVTFIALLSACSHAGLVEKAWQLYNSMIHDYAIEPDMEHYSCMVDLLGKTGDIDGAYKFITTLPVTPNTNVLGSLLGACRIHNKVELAEILAEHIFQLNAEDPGHYVLLSNLYASREQWKNMSKVRSMIKDKGLEKKPASSWIQIGHKIHVFHATSKFHPEFAKIEEILDSLVSVMKGEDCLPEEPEDLFPCR